MKTEQDNKLFGIIPAEYKPLAFAGGGVFALGIITTIIKNWKRLSDGLSDKPWNNVSQKRLREAPPADAYYCGGDYDKFYTDAKNWRKHATASDME